MWFGARHLSELSVFSLAVVVVRSAFPKLVFCRTVVWYPEKKCSVFCVQPSLGNAKPKLK